MSMAVQQECEVFELLVDEKTVDGYPLIVTRCPAGGAKEFCQLDPDDDELKGALEIIDRRQTDPAFLEQIGDFLFQELFTEDIEALYRTSLGIIRSYSKRLHIRLRIEPPALSALPWEYMYDVQEGSPLATSSEISLSRHVPLRLPTRSTVVNLPLKVLVVIANPLDMPSLNITAEKKVLQNALDNLIQQGQVELVYEEQATKEKISQKIDSFQPHVFHFVGHSTFEENGACVILENEDDYAYPVDERTFQELFWGARETRLAILNACETAATSASQPAIGLAPRLLQRQLSAVVAMQQEIPDDSAVIFVREFYQSLALGHSIDAAISDARRGIRLEIGREVPDWGIPVLFSHAEEGHLFHIEKPTESDVDIPPAPMMRPARTEYFVGRSTAQKEILTKLYPGNVVTLCGPAGIGKTALAAEIAWQLAPNDSPPERFPDGIFFHNFYSQPQAALALESIAHTFGETPQPNPLTAARRALAGKRALLILDGTESADNLHAVLTVRDQCGVLMTSRQRKDAIAIRHDISPLPQGDALTLLQAWGGKRAQDDNAVRRICELVGQLPLAVRLAGRYLNEQELYASEYLEWLKETPLSALDLGQRQQESIPLLLERSLAQVSGNAQQALGCVGILALAPFDQEIIAAALNLSPISTRQALGELVNYGLLQRLAQAYTVSHALVHTYARRRLTPPIEVVKRITLNYITFISESDNDFSQLDDVRPHLLALLNTCHDSKLWQEASRLVLEIDPYLDFQGYWTERLSSCKVGLVSAQMLRERSIEGIYLGKLGATYRKLGQYENSISYCQQALRIAQEINDRHSESENLGRIGYGYFYLSQYEDSIYYCQQALRIAQEISDRRNESVHQTRLGNTFAYLGQYKRAIDCYQQALKIVQAIDDRRNECAIIVNLGTSYVALGEYKTGIEYNQQSLRIAREIGDRYLESMALSQQGRAHHELGQYENALNYSQQALMIARQIGDRYNDGIIHGNLGITYYELGQYENALSYGQQALTIARQIGDRLNENYWLGALGRVFAAQGKIETAIEFYQQALTIASEIDSLRNQSTHLGYLGRAYRNLGQYETALDYHQKALAIAQKVGYRQGEGIHLVNLGNTYRNMGEYEIALDYQQKALAIARTINDRRSEGTTLGHIGRTYAGLEKYETAIDYYGQALVLARKVKDRRGEGIHLGHLGNAYERLEKYDTAIDYLQRSLTIAQELGDHRAEGSLLGYLGRAYDRLGQVENATDFYRQSIVILDEVKSPDVEDVRKWLSAIDESKAESLPHNE